MTSLSYFISFLSSPPHTPQPHRPHHTPTPPSGGGCGVVGAGVGWGGWWGTTTGKGGKKNKKAPNRIRKPRSAVVTLPSICDARKGRFRAMAGHSRNESKTTNAKTNKHNTAHRGRQAGGALLNNIMTKKQYNTLKQLTERNTRTMANKLRRLSASKELFSETADALALIGKIIAASDNLFDVVERALVYEGIREDFRLSLWAACKDLENASGKTLHVQEPPFIPREPRRVTPSEI